ncbi:MAG: carbohydrate kinase family protein [Clostridiales bacterium]|jgi:sugar/nucleoside kinase (ribokinase family)|nr:carbohydrate kinase family protein [Clostridiales bacterium]
MDYYDIIGLGTPVKDLLITIDDMPVRDSAIMINDYSSQGGGKVSTAMVAAARLGAKVSMCGVVGSDSKGEFIIEDFKRHGIDVSHMVIDEGKTSVYCLCIAEKETQTRRFFGKAGTARMLALEDMDYDYLKSAKIIHVESGNNVIRNAVEFAKKEGVTVSIDADNYTEEIENMEHLIDIFIASEFYYKKRFPSLSHEEGLACLAEKGCKIAIFTLGSRGCVGLYNNEYFSFPAFTGLNIIDTTGAGDVFHGAYLSAYLKGIDPKECARVASAVSAIKCTRIGGRSGIPDWDMTRSFLDNNQIVNEETLDKRVDFYRSKVF